MTDLSPILELHRQTGDLLRQSLQSWEKENEALRQLLSEHGEDEPPLFFNDKQRTIRWTEGIAKLSEKQYRLLKFLWECENHSAFADEIEEAVWGIADSGKRPFVQKSTFFMLIYRTQTSVMDAGFPYELSGVKTDAENEFQYFRLAAKKQPKNVNGAVKTHARIGKM